jgi:predicted nucleic acid-binding protein
VALTELLVGAFRGTPDAQKMRQEFIAQMRLDVPVYPYSIPMAELAGRLGGRQAAIGQTIPPMDLMIGATALFHGYSLLTTNVRHFRMIPGLHVIPF